MAQSRQFMRSCASLRVTFIVLITSSVCMAADSWADWTRYERQEAQQYKTGKTTSQSSATSEDAVETDQSPTSNAWSATTLLALIVLVIIISLFKWKPKPKKPPVTKRSNYSYSYSSAVHERHTTSNQRSQIGKRSNAFQFPIKSSDNQAKSQPNQQNPPPDHPNSNEQNPPEDHPNSTQLRPSSPSNDYFPFNNVNNPHHIPQNYSAYPQQHNSIFPHQLNVHLPLNSTVFVGEPHARIKFVTKEGNSDVQYMDERWNHPGYRGQQLPITSSQDSPVNLSPPPSTSKNHSNPFQHRTNPNHNQGHRFLSSHDREIRQDMPLATMQRRDYNASNINLLQSCFKPNSQRDSTSRQIKLGSLPSMMNQLPHAIKTRYSFLRSEVKQAPQIQNASSFAYTQERQLFGNPSNILRNRQNSTNPVSTNGDRILHRPDSAPIYQSNAVGHRHILPGSGYHTRPGA